MNLMARLPGTPRDTPPASGAPELPVISGERCDRCGAAPRHRVAVSYTRDGRRVPGELLFCTHHYERLRPALIASLTGSRG